MSLIKYESVEQKNDVLNIMRSYKYKHRVYGKDTSIDALDHSISLEPVEDFLSYNENNEFLEIDMMKESNSITINRVLETLSKRERIVLEMYFGINRDEPMSLNDIGEEFCLTRERIREIKIKAIQRLSHKSRSNYLRNN